VQICISRPRRLLPIIHAPLSPSAGLTIGRTVKFAPNGRRSDRYCGVYFA
jgi:hypothetical protein